MPALKLIIKIIFSDEYRVMLILSGIVFTVQNISMDQVHEELAAQAGRAVNLSLTLRNWLIGTYIAEYELSGRGPGRLWR